ncbi:MAG TPA: glycosyltransferase family 4 protein [Candidatus Paceibacterota bacterium]
MKILIATGIYPPEIGGPATYSKALAEELTRRGHIVTLLTYYSAPEPETPFRFVAVSRKLPKGIRHAVYFWKALYLSRGADVVFAQDPVSVGVPAFIAARILRKQFFLKVVGDYAWEQGMQRFGVADLLDIFLNKKYGFRVEMLRRVEYCVARHADGIIVPSGYLKGVVEKWGVESARITVIPNGISMSYVPPREDARQALAIDGIIFVSVGRLVPWKGFSFLVSLLPKITGNLVIIGEGPDRKKLEDRAKELGVSNRVIFTGSLPKEKMSAYCAAADAFLLNTAYEGFSHQILEAMATGVPVITTMAGGNKEIIRPGENALSAGYNNEMEWLAAIKKILGDKALRARISSNAIEDVKKYTYVAMIANIETILAHP